MNHEDILNHIRDFSLEAVENAPNSPAVLARLKDLEGVIDECKKMVMESALEYVSQFGKEGTDVGGYHMAVKNGACRWYYQGDVYKKKKEELEQIQEIAKLAARTQQPLPFGPDRLMVDPAISKYDSDTVVLTKQRKQTS